MMNGLINHKPSTAKLEIRVRIAWAGSGADFQHYFKGQACEL